MKKHERRSLSYRTDELDLRAHPSRLEFLRNRWIGGSDVDLPGGLWVVLR